MSENYFQALNNINVNGKTEKKNGLTYLSWAWAWGEVKKLYPDADYTIYENADGWFYHTDGKTCWVKTGVTVNGIEHIEYLPVMDFKNKSIPANAVTSFDVNKAIQRSLTKACARHGLGLYIYAGEDLPEEEMQAPKPQKQEKPATPPPLPDVMPSKVPSASTADMRGRIATILHELTGGKVEDMRTGVHHWTNGVCTQIAEIPGDMLPEVLDKAESLYRKRKGAEFGG